MSFVRTLFIVLPMVSVALAVLIFVADRIHRRPIAGAALVMGAIGFVPVWVMIPSSPMCLRPPWPASWWSSPSCPASRGG